MTERRKEREGASKQARERGREHNRNTHIQRGERERHREIKKKELHVRTRPSEKRQIWNKKSIYRRKAAKEDGVVRFKNKSERKTHKAKEKRKTSKTWMVKMQKTICANTTNSKEPAPLPRGNEIETI